MNSVGMDDLVEKAFEKIREMRATKGKDYAGEEDVLANFKEAATRLGLTPEQIWAVYADKHWSAIMTYCREGQVESEPIGGRIIDVMTYCTLLLAMVSEARQLDPGEGRTTLGPK